MSETKVNICDLDLYALFGVAVDADTAMIKRAFRKKALECHPDKNAGDPKCVALFHQLSEALHLLVDAKSREAYDKVFRARQAAIIRNAKLDAEILFYKTKLEKAENAKPEQDSMKIEIERLRKEGLEIVEEENRKMEMKMKMADESRERSTAILKAKWDPNNQFKYTEDILTRIFYKYGDIRTLFISKKKKCTAVIEFEKSDAADMALRFEIGRVENPLTVTRMKSSTSR